MCCKNKRVSVVFVIVGFHSPVIRMIGSLMFCLLHQRIGAFDPVFYLASYTSVPEKALRTSSSRHHAPNPKAPACQCLVLTRSHRLCHSADVNIICTVCECTQDLHFRSTLSLANQSPLRPSHSFFLLQKLLRRMFLTAVMFILYRITCKTDLKLFFILTGNTYNDASFLF